MLYAKICNKYLPNNQNNPAKDGRSTENKANRARKEEKLQICRLAPVARDNDDCGEKFRKLSVFKGVSNPRTRNILSLISAWFNRFSSYKNYRWGDSSSILAQTCPQKPSQSA